MAHEVTVHFPISYGRRGKKWVVAPSVINGKQYSEEEVIKMFKEGKVKALDVFNSEPAAKKYVVKRSKGFDITKDMHE